MCIENKTDPLKNAGQVIKASLKKGWKYRVGDFFLFFQLALSLTYSHPGHVSLILFLWIPSWSNMTWGARQHPCEVGKQKKILKYIYSLSQLSEEWEVSLCSGGITEEPALPMCCWNSFMMQEIVALPLQQEQGCRPSCHWVSTSQQHPASKGWNCLSQWGYWELCCPLHALCYFELWKREP